MLFYCFDVILSMCVGIYIKLEIRFPIKFVFFAFIWLVPIAAMGPDWDLRG